MIPGKRFFSSSLPAYFSTRSTALNSVFHRSSLAEYWLRSISTESNRGRKGSSSCGGSASPASRGRRKRRSGAVRRVDSARICCSRHSQTLQLYGRRSCNLQTSRTISVNRRRSKSIMRKSRENVASCAAKSCPRWRSSATHDTVRPLTSSTLPRHQRRQPFTTPQKIW